MGASARGGDEINYLMNFLTVTQSCIQLVPCWAFIYGLCEQLFEISFFGCVIINNEMIRFSIKEPNMMMVDLQNWLERSIQVIVDTDGEQILGLGVLDVM